MDNKIKATDAAKVVHKIDTFARCAIVLTWQAVNCGGRAPGLVRDVVIELALISLLVPVSVTSAAAFVGLAGRVVVMFLLRLVRLNHFFVHLEVVLVERI